MQKRGTACRVTPMAMAVVAAIAVLAMPSTSRSDVVHDGTLGPGGVFTFDPNFVVDYVWGYLVPGAVFHSFSVLEVASGETLSFSAPSDANAIVVRVTGPAPTVFDGSVSSPVPLYIFNPNGVSLGPNGSYVNSTSVAYTATNYDEFVIPSGDVFDQTTTPLDLDAGDFRPPYSICSVPEPSMALSLATGAAAVAFAQERRKQGRDPHERVETEPPRHALAARRSCPPRKRAPEPRAEDTPPDPA